jgi:PAS domain S-box-containing protein
MDPRDFKSLLRQAVVVPVLLVALLATVLLWQIIYLGHAVKVGQQTQETESYARQFLRYALDMETGLRGYLLTGESEYLEPYHSAESMIPERLALLKFQLKDDQNLLEHVNRLENSYNAWHDFSTQMLAAGPGSAMASSRQENLRGKLLMDGIRGEREELLNLLDRASNEKNSTIHRVTRQTLTIVLVLSALVAIAIALLTRRATTHLTQNYVNHIEQERRSVAEATEARQWLITTLTSMSEAVITADQHGKIAFMNPAAEILTGLTSSETLSLPVNDVLTLLEEHSREPIPALKRALENHASSMTQIGNSLLRRSDAQTVFVEHSITPIKTGNTFSGVVVILRDVSERRRSEAALRSSERLSLLGRLAATIAHEIRNPLDAVLNLVYLLRTSAQIDDVGRSFAVTAEDELKRIAQITHQLLAFNRESTKPVATDVSELLSGVLKLFAPKLSAAGITVKSQFSTSRSVIALPGELRQVFSNLIANAIDVLPRGGVIAVKVSDAQEHGLRSREGVRITIADNGPGIPEQVISSLFTPFFTTKGEKGTGLGLWVSRGIITKHEGELQLRSMTEGARKGTVFSIFLPMRPESRALQSPAA